VGARAALADRQAVTIQGLAVDLVVVLAGTPPARLVGQARQPQELVGHAAAGARPALRRPAVPGHLIMARRQLLNLKQLAERRNRQGAAKD